MEKRCHLVHLSYLNLREHIFESIMEVDKISITAIEEREESELISITSEFWSTAQTKTIC